VARRLGTEGGGSFSARKDRAAAGTSDAAGGRLEQGAAQQNPRTGIPKKERKAVFSLMGVAAFYAAVRRKSRFARSRGLLRKSPAVLCVVRVRAVARRCRGNSSHDVKGGRTL